MTEMERPYICQSCGKAIDRDINASINIEREGLRIKEIPMERRDLKPVEIETSLDSSVNLKVSV
jgi:transposase